MEECGAKVVRLTVATIMDMVGTGRTTPATTTRHIHSLPHMARTGKVSNHTARMAHIRGVSSHINSLGTSSLGIGAEAVEGTIRTTVGEDREAEVDTMAVRTGTISPMAVGPTTTPPPLHTTITREATAVADKEDMAEGPLVEEDAGEEGTITTHMAAMVVDSRTPRVDMDRVLTVTVVVVVIITRAEVVDASGRPLNRIEHNVIVIYICSLLHIVILLHSYSVSHNNTGL